MSLFDTLTQGEIIKDTRHLAQHEKLRKKRKEKMEEKEKREWEEYKARRDKAKKDMTEEEFRKFIAREWARRNKEIVAQKALARYHKNKAETDAMVSDIMDEMWPMPDLRSIDEIYTEKYRGDDINGEGKFKFYWRDSPLLWEKVSRLPKIQRPIRVFNRNLDKIIRRAGAEQDKAHEYILPHIGEISLRDFGIAKRQILSKHPMWRCNGNMIDLVNNTTISTTQICNVASALLRGKYICSELYLGRVSFLVGDVIITTAGNVIRPMLNNSLPHLTPETADELHEKRMQYFHKEIKAPDVPIYILRDTYLVKIPINERENFYYIIPT